MKTRKLVARGLALAILTVTPAFANDFAEGLRRIDRADWDGAVSSLRAPAGQGDPFAQYWVGKLGPDLEALSRAAGSGHVDAMRALGFAWSESRPDVARAWFEQAAARGDSQSRLILVAAVLPPHSFPLSEAGAEDRVKERVASGDPTALRLACQYAGDIGRIVLWDACRAAAAAGEPEAQFRMASLYDRWPAGHLSSAEMDSIAAHLALPHDMGMAKHLYSAAAARGHGQALARLAFRHVCDRSDEGVEQARAAARHASENGVPLGDAVLGLLAARDRNWPEAVRLWDTASARGEAVAFVAMAQMALHGPQSQQSAIKAAEWVDLARMAQGLPPRECLERLSLLPLDHLEFEAATLLSPADRLLAKAQAARRRHDLAAQGSWPAGAQRR